MKKRRQQKSNKVERKLNKQGKELESKKESHLTKKKKEKKGEC